METVREADMKIGEAGEGFLGKFEWFGYFEVIFFDNLWIQKTRRKANCVF